MLTEEEIEKLIEPIVQRQSNLSSAIIYTIAKRIKAIEDIDPDSLYTIEQALRTSKDLKEIDELITEVLFLQYLELSDVLDKVAKNTYESSKVYYDAIGRSFIDYENSVRMKRITDEVIKVVSTKIRNISKSIGFMIDKFLNPNDTYKQVVNTAISSATLIPKKDYYVAIRPTLNKLNQSGLRVISYNEDNKPYTQRFDVAIRTIMLNGVRDVQQAIENQVGLEIDSDGIELSVHEYPAPDHAPIQGHQFTNGEFKKLQNAEPFEDVDGNKFDAIARPIGAWNCRHFTIHIIIGLTEPGMNDKQLQAILDRNEKGYTTKKGKHLTLYECTQMQRYYEREIRKAKEGLNMSKLSGDLESSNKYSGKVDKLIREYFTFSRDCGLRAHPEKIQILGI